MSWHSSQIPVNDKMSPEIKHMAAAVVSQAVKDLHCKKLTQSCKYSSNMRNHVSAVCWLASKNGSIWFDLIAIDQEASLPKLRWDVYAKALLSGDKKLLSDNQRKMITTTLKYFDA